MKTRHTPDSRQQKHEASNNFSPFHNLLDVFRLGPPPESRNLHARHQLQRTPIIRGISQMSTSTTNDSQPDPPSPKNISLLPAWLPTRQSVPRACFLPPRPSILLGPPLSQVRGPSSSSILHVLSPGSVGFRARLFADFRRNADTGTRTRTRTEQEEEQGKEELKPQSIRRPKPKN